MSLLAPFCLVGGSLAQSDVSERAETPGVTRDGDCREPRFVAEIEGGLGGPGDRFGIQVLLRGNRMFVQGRDTGYSVKPHSGSVHVLSRREDGRWREEGAIVPRNPTAHASFGKAMALQDDVLVVGAPGQRVSGLGPARYAGKAYVFRRHAESGGWLEEQVLEPEAGQSYDTFGNAVAIGARTIVVGAPYDDLNGEPDVGTVHVFERSGDGGWTLTQLLVPPTIARWQRFGASISIDGDRMAVGAPERSIRNTGGGIHL